MRKTNRWGMGNQADNPSTDQTQTTTSIIIAPFMLTPPPPSAVTAATYWESCVLRCNENWEEFVIGTLGPREMEQLEYSVVFWSLRDRGR
jgi:hypothetical protein